MDLRKQFVTGHLRTFDRILELGPLNRPIVLKKDFPNCIYCDIRCTEDVKDLYSGNAYLESTGLMVDTSTIVDIDDVIVGSYSGFYENKEKFDVVVASHVLEHMPDIIFSIRDIAGILKSGGIFCIVYPDKRYCFDHFRQSASFRDAYNVFVNGVEFNAPMVLDFFLSSISENNPFKFWSNDSILDLLEKKDFKTVKEYFEAAKSGVQMDDVHYWPFTDWDFLFFLYQCTSAGLLPFRCIDFIPTQENDQQFFVALQYDPDIKDIDDALTNIKKYMSIALPHFYSNSFNLEMAELRKHNTDLVSENKRLQNICCELDAIKNSTSWRLTSPLRRIMDLLKNRG